MDLTQELVTTMRKIKETSKKALVIGANGQDGFYLSKHLKSLGYVVYKTTRRKSNKKESTSPLKLYLDLASPDNLYTILNQVQPDEVYNLAAQSHVGESFKDPSYTTEVTGNGAIKVFEACRKYRDLTNKSIRIYQASSSEMYGTLKESIADESTEFNPQSPYAVAKLAAHNMAKVYRESYDLFISCGILFNHESPRRGPEFVTRKVTQGLVRVSKGLQDKVTLGNLDSVRDWGDARDYVKAMHLMLNSDTPKDYVIATGEINSIHQLVNIVCKKLDLSVKKVIETNRRYVRPNDVTYLKGNSSLAQKELGWSPEISFEETITNMVEYDKLMIGLK